MKTLSKGRKTPINDLTNLRFVVEPVDYIRQSKSVILNAKCYVELRDENFLVKHLEKDINKVMFFSNYPDYGALITGEVYKFYNNELTKLSVYQRIKWHYEHDVKGLFRRLWVKPQYALNYSSSMLNLFKNGRFSIRTSTPKFDFSTSAESWTDEENWLFFDALRLAQLTSKNEQSRPSCISELIDKIIKAESAYIDSFYVSKIVERNMSVPDCFEDIYQISFIYSLIGKDLMIDYAPFLKRYKPVLDKSTSIKQMNDYYNDYKQYLHMNRADRFQRNLLCIPRRIWEIIA